MIVISNVTLESHKYSTNDVISVYGSDVQIATYRVKSSHYSVLSFDGAANLYT